MQSVAWFHCFAGIAGDMALGSLLDAGADLDEVLNLLHRIPLDGWGLEVEEVLRGGMACTRALVTVTGTSAPSDDVGRTHARIAELVNLARLPERVTDRTLSIFDQLARAEGRVHRTDPSAVHFHEVGGHDAIIDVVGTAAALEVLGVDAVASSPVAVGTGTVRTDHGILPNPSPAVVCLLHGIPTYGRATTVELTTPTGAAILAALCEDFGPMPPMQIGATGFGAGAAELDELPNCAQVVVGLSTDPGSIGDGQPVMVLETNVDDATGEQLAHAVTRLMEAGAHDAWITPIVMKKGRPAHTLHALCDRDQTAPLREIIRLTTGTFGVRTLSGVRWPVPRGFAGVEVGGHHLTVKVGPERVKAEFDDVADVADRTGLGVHEVSSRAEEAWRRGQETPAEQREGGTR